MKVEAIQCNQCKRIFMPDELTDLKDDNLSAEAIRSNVIVIETGFTPMMDGSEQVPVYIDGHYCNLDCLRKYIEEQKKFD